MAELLALIDLGSNATRFLVAKVSPGKGFHIVRDERVQTRLAAGANGRLPASAVERTVAATRRFVRSLTGRRPRILAIGTAAVRDAGNGERLVARLRNIGVTTVEILTPEAEGRLGATAAIDSLPLDDAVIVDIGGGSMQVTEVRDRRVGGIASRPLGAVRLTRRFLHADPASATELRTLRRETRRQLDALGPALASGPLVGLGGTVRAIARMHLAATNRRKRTLHGLRLPAQAVADLAGRLAVCSLRQRRRFPGLKHERADIIVAGAIVLDEVLARSGRDAILVCERGVRHGVLIRETFDRVVPA